ncbi:MAG: DNA (cytosine-5-)-methyltransferase [Bacteroidota bacterium]
MLDEKGKRAFKIALSIEKEYFAHQTLTLRSFFRQFEVGGVPDDYYQLLKGKITLDELYDRWPKQAKFAKEEAWQATLGDGENANSSTEVDQRISRALKGNQNWLLIGGPPCQAYSIVGRSRRRETILNEKTDERVGLYKQYLRILAVHNPAVFIMENVKGLLSAETKESPVFGRILNDLSNPVKAYLTDFNEKKGKLQCPGYKIYSLVVKAREFDLDENPVFHQKDFIIKAEKHGIPQTRHRVILLGIRRSLDLVPGILQDEDEVPISKVLAGLPKLRSSLTREVDGVDAWKDALSDLVRDGILSQVDRDVKEEIRNQLLKVTTPQQGFGADYIPSSNIGIKYESDWFLDEQIEGVCNHFSRGHMRSDLLRYFFIACFGKVHGVSPKLSDLPPRLLPDHENVDQGIKEKKFADRFRVQLSNKPSKTITSHISKDGHYYIYPDPTQCRSLTVREAARIQTFPDNYFFCGPRTAQFIQVGNAVPPLLARRLADIVSVLFLQIK